MLKRAAIVPILIAAIAAAALLAFALSFDDFIITSFVAGPRLTFPPWVYGAVKNGLPPPGFAFGRLIFGGGLALAILNALSHMPAPQRGAPPGDHQERVARRPGGARPRPRGPGRRHDRVPPRVRAAEHVGQRPDGRPQRLHLRRDTRPRPVEDRRAIALPNGQQPDPGAELGLDVQDLLAGEAAGSSPWTTPPSRRCAYPAAARSAAARSTATPSSSRYTAPRAWPTSRSTMPRS